MQPTCKKDSCFSMKQQGERVKELCLNFSWVLNRWMVR